MTCTAKPWARFRIIAAATVAFAALAAPAPFAGAATTVGDCSPGSTWGTVRSDFASRVVDLVNQHRQAMGLKPLKLSGSLTSSAVWKARHMAWLKYMTHDDPAPPVARTWAQRLAACGYGWAAGENIAYGYSTPEAVLQGWLSSSSHRAAIENPYFVVTGVGAAASSAGTLYWTENFGTYDDSVATAAPPAPTGSRYSAVVLGAGPTSYLRLGETSGATAFDASGWGYPGAYSGVALGVPGAIVGDASTAVSFDGVNDRVFASKVPITGAFSLELWAYPRGSGFTGATAYGALLGWDYYHRLLWRVSDGLLLAQFDGNFFSTVPVYGQSWHHVVYAFDGFYERFYVDGAAAGVHATTRPTWSQAYRIGDYDGTNYLFNGSIDEVAVYRRALSASEVQSHFAAGRGQ